MVVKRTAKGVKIKTDTKETFRKYDEILITKINSEDFVKQTFNINDEVIIPSSLYGFLKGTVHKVMNKSLEVTFFNHTYLNRDGSKGVYYQIPALKNKILKAEYLIHG